MSLMLYKLNASPPARTAMMVCELFKVPVKMVDVNLSKGEHFSPEYLKVNQHRKYRFLLGVLHQYSFKIMHVVHVKYCHWFLMRVQPFKLIRRLEVGKLRLKIPLHVNKHTYTYTYTYNIDIYIHMHIHIHRCIGFY